MARHKTVLVRRRFVELVKRYGQHDVNGLAAELSYRMLVALFPLFVFFAALGGWIAAAWDAENPAEAIVDAIGDALPDDAASFVEGELESLLDAPGGLPLVLGFFGVLWTGTTAMEVAVKGLNRIHRLEDQRSRFRKYIVAFALTIGAGMLLIGGVAAWATAQALAPPLVTAALWPISFLAIVAVATLLYWIGPARERRFRWVSAGGIIFAITWLLGSIGFAVYVQTAGGNLNATYGALSGALLLLGWIYLTSVAFFLGAEIDVLLTEEVGDVSG